MTSDPARTARLLRAAQGGGAPPQQHQQQLIPITAHAEGVGEQSLLWRLGERFADGSVATPTAIGARLTAECGLHTSEAWAAGAITSALKRHRAACHPALGQPRRVRLRLYVREPTAAAAAPLATATAADVAPPAAGAPPSLAYVDELAWDCGTRADSVERYVLAACRDLSLGHAWFAAISAQLSSLVADCAFALVSGGAAAAGLEVDGKAAAGKAGGAKAGAGPAAAVAAQRFPRLEPFDAAEEERVLSAPGRKERAAARQHAEEQLAAERKRRAVGEAGGARPAAAAAQSPAGATPPQVAGVAAAAAAAAAAPETTPSRLTRAALRQ
jgi:hypothetical protein